MLRQNNKFENLFKKDNPTYIIAEIGSNHNRHKKTVVEMIDKAAVAGVDAIKFQTFYADDFISINITPSNYGLDNIYKESTWREDLESLDITV